MRAHTAKLQKQPKRKKPLKRSNQKLGTPRELSPSEKIQKVLNKNDPPPPKVTDLSGGAKATGKQEHSREGGHHLPPHKPDDPCAKAGSPEKVENCKKAGEAWEHSK